MALQKLAMDSISLDGKRVFMRYNIWIFSLKMILCKSFVYVMFYSIRKFDIPNTNTG